jgi:micrococcal nuclease
MASVSTPVILGVAAVIGLGAGSLMSVVERRSASATVIARQFTVCHTGGGTNCVVDGDTIWLDGEKIRVADIDTPETHDPKCQAELELGLRARTRLHELVNSGSFEVRSIGSRDADQYGRKLRVLVRDGRSIGYILVREGFARTWTGKRQPWC